MINNKLVVYEDKRFKVSCGADVFNRIKEININHEQENFLVFYLNNQNRIITQEVLFIGAVDSCLICPNNIFRRALLNNSNTIIIAHNHPASSLEPSPEDLEVFEQLKEAGETIKIKVLDSIIFNNEGYFSTITDVI